MGATQLWQQHILPPSPGTEPGQQQVMKWMPVVFVAMLYRISSGLVLYWTVSNMLSIFQTYVTRTVDDPAARPGAAVVKKKV
jgi:YidC/Oxa1 family membrane protein insertase